MIMRTGGLLAMLFGLHVALVPLAHAQSETDVPFLTVIDRFLNFQYVTHTEDWAFSPVGRHGVIITNPTLSATLNFKKAVISQTVDDAIAAYRERVESNEDLGLLAAEQEAIVAGKFTATGVLVENTSRERTTLQLWFEKDGNLFDTYCEASNEHFEAAVSECRALWATFGAIR